MIGKLGLAGFFLLHHDMLELAREVALEVRGPDSVRALLAPGRGRGSSVSSLVCYLIGLSHIDPIANRLALGRFLHEDLRGLPDIDLDFPRDIREVLIPRVHERYGHDRAALVAAFPTFRARGAIRELGKVLGLPAGEIERIARGADTHGSGAEHDIAVAPGVIAGSTQPGGLCPHPAGAAAAPSERWRWLARLVEQAHGLPRHLSQHSGGMIVATRPLIDCCPVVPAAMEGRQMVQWDKDSCADAGFLKIDLLGLGMLSAVERCVEMIARTRSERIDLSRIPFDDRETFGAIRKADTVGVFQIESRAQMQSLRRTRPGSLEELTVQVAIVRPGPIQGGAINPYIERRRRLREDPLYEVPYAHPTLVPVLESTLGTVIFQDQVIEVAEAFAGFSPGEADGLRRAMSRKRSRELLEGHRERFLTGAERHVGADRATAERVWEMVAGFAGFGFPKAHSAAFGLLAYQSTWLRVHYGPEFLCALLNEQPMGFYAPDSLVHEAEHRGIAVLGLDVNGSAVQCTVQDGSVRLGLGYIKDVTSTEMRELVLEREQNGPFRSLGELAARIGAGRRSLEQLAWSGACDSLTTGAVGRRRPGRVGPVASAELRSVGEAGRRSALWQLGMAAPGKGAGEGTQLALPLELPAAPSLRPLGRWQRLIADYATSGVTVGDHAMAILRKRLAVPSDHRSSIATSAQLARLPTGCAVAVAGLVIARQRPGTAKGTMFLLFEDEWGTVNLIVPKAVYERHRHLARAEPLLLARGRLERSEGVVNVIVRELAALERFLSPGAQDGEEGAAIARVHRLPGSERSPESTEDALDAEEEAEAEVGIEHARRGPARAELRDGAATVGTPTARFRQRASTGRLICIARLGNTDLDVFPLCLGGNVFGWTIDEERSFAVLDAYVEAGGNFIDTADTYGRRGTGGAGESERIIGRWIAARGNREKLVIATKVGMSPSCVRAFRGDDSTGDRRLARRLAIDTVDLYYAHQDDPGTPLEETLGAFAALIEEGKIRYAAASNYSAARLSEALADRRRRGDGLLCGAAAALQPDGARGIRGRAGRAVRAARPRLRPLLRPGPGLSHRQVPPRGRAGRQPPRGRRARELLQRAGLRGAGRAG